MFIKFRNFLTEDSITADCETFKCFGYYLGLHAALKTAWLTLLTTQDRNVTVY
uniref:Uncharacterized protein n=1 Tax=Anguilla anguilla TaxID=7936 RepID=A0A0E9PIV3_ANGAN